MSNGKAKESEVGSHEISSDRAKNIKQPHDNDVLCGRGIGTNKYPGNERFRSLVSLNKELYVTSTKKQKKSISLSIIKTIRGLNPPGHFLEKDPLTELWSDIGDDRAIEKTCQALRDGADEVRKELSEDLSNPKAFMNLFENEGSMPSAPTSRAKERSRPAKRGQPKKGHRRTKTYPTAAKRQSEKENRRAKSHCSPTKYPASSFNNSDDTRPASPLSSRSHPYSPEAPEWANYDSYYHTSFPGPYQSSEYHWHAYPYSPSRGNTPHYPHHTMQHYPAPWTYGPQKYGHTYPPHAPVSPGYHYNNVVPNGHPHFQQTPYKNSHASHNSYKDTYYPSPNTENSVDNAGDNLDKKNVIDTVSESDEDELSPLPLEEPAYDDRCIDYREIDFFIRSHIPVVNTDDSKRKKVDEKEKNYKSDDDSFQPLPFDF